MGRIAEVLAGAVEPGPHAVRVEGRAWRSLGKSCQVDYESFTDSWLPADMTPGGRIPQAWIRCADPQPWEHPKMIETLV